MFNETISAALLQVTSIWSKEIGRAYSLDVEYTIAINLILTKTVNYLAQFLTDNTSLLLISLIALVIVLPKFGLNISYDKFFPMPNTITVDAIEKYHDNGTQLICSNSFKAINLLIIEKYNVKNLRYINENLELVVDNINNLKIDKDLYLTVKKTQNDEKINITLTSYHINLNLLIKNAVKIYCKNNNYQLILHGKEINDVSYVYPDAMLYITYVLVNIYKMNRLKVLNESSTELLPKNPEIVNNNNNNSTSKKEEFKNLTKTIAETQSEMLDNFNKKIKNIYLLDNCKNHLIENDIYITIERLPNVVKYILSSCTSDLKDFLKKCIKLYKQDILQNEYKYTLKITGYEQMSNSNSKIQYPHNLIALCDMLITKHNINNFRIIDVNKEPIKIIDDIVNLKVDDILINIIKNVSSPNYWETFMSVTYILESNVVNLSKYMEDCVKNYDDSFSKKNDNILYYFKYLGRINGELKFSKVVLSGPNNILYETFDFIHNEHVEVIKEDLRRLKDLEYYKKTGLRRKKSYLLHGPPGTGKTAFVTGMALYDNRHIISIPLNIVQYNSEMDELMNILTICGVIFRKDQIIITFDEMDIGLDKIINGGLQKQNDTTDIQNEKDKIKNTSEFESNKNKDIDEKLSFDSLNFTTLLTLIDGMGNYAGLVIVGLTNCFEKIPIALRRSFRLTPKHFTYLRQIDAIKLIERHYNEPISENLINLIPDRKIISVDLLLYCEQYNNKSMSEFIEQLNINLNSIITTQIC